jgi:ABC-type transport system substrate-binding protein
VPADAGLTRGGIGYLDELRFQVYPDAVAIAAAVRRGDVDLAPARATDTTRVQSGPGPEVEYVGLPTGTAPFDQPQVRRALALALSRTELVRRLFPRTRLPATGFLPPTTGRETTCDALPADGDRAAAVALLRKAGVDLRGTSVVLYVNDDARNTEVAAEVARQWRDAFGLVATPTTLPFDAFLAKGRGADGFAAPFRFSWAATDPDGYVTPLFTPDAIGRDNLSRFDDPALAEALKRRAWRAVDAADRSLAYQRIAALVCAQMPMIPLTTSLRRYVVGGGIASASGAFVDGSTGQPLLRELYRRPA